MSRVFVVEFAGTPRAGKTTALNGLRERLEGDGYQVHVVEERARLSPVPRKRDPDFNVWTAMTSMANMVEAAHARAQIALVDRGVLDALCWMDWHLRSGQLGRKDRAVTDRFLLARSRLVDLVLLMTVTPSVAVKRDIASGRDRSASMIVSPALLSAINRSIYAVRRRHAGQFPLVRHVDTTGLDRAATLDLVVSHVLTAVAAAGILNSQAVPDPVAGPPPG
jgi:thymidylate kinase